jgi:hypothetical protein
MPRELNNVVGFSPFGPYSRKFENRLTSLVAAGLRAPKNPIGGCISALLQECAAREGDESFHPVQTLCRASGEIEKVARVRHERDPSRLISYIEKLPEPDRTIIELRMAGLNYRETAQRLGLNKCRVLDVLSTLMAAMASIDAYAPPLKPSPANTSHR